jgi:predicted phosphoadenosine phosphosulfate sulfurtransferase
VTGRKQTEQTEHGHAVGRLLSEHHPLGVNVWEAALDRAARIVDRFDHVAVLFSGGKDSTAALNVTLEACRAAGRLPLRVVFYDEEAIPLQTVDYVRRVAARPDVELEWYCTPTAANNACSPTSPFWWPWEEESRHLWVRDWPDEGRPLGPIADMPRELRPKHAEANRYLIDPKKHGSSALVMGIRATESMMRHNAVVHRTEDNYLVPAPDGMYYRAYPIYDWRNEDVWTAPAQMGWDYNRAYDVLRMAGLSTDQQRMAPPFGAEPMQSLWTFKECFPEVWDKMTDRVPGAAAAARYARTELYSFGSSPEKPPGLTWPAFVRQLIERNHAPETQPKVAGQIATAIRKHFRKTTEPILPDTGHPDTGVSWKFLATIAHRGDPWGRRVAQFRLAYGEKREPQYAKYRAELARLEEAGQLGQIDPRRP